MDYLKRKNSFNERINRREVKIQKINEFQLLCDLAAKKLKEKDLSIQNEESSQSEEIFGDQDVGISIECIDEKSENTIEEPDNDFPFSNLDKITRYFSKKSEHRILQLMKKKTTFPRLFGTKFVNTVIPETKEKLAVFLKKVVELKDEYKSKVELLDTIAEESGEETFSFPEDYAPKGQKFFYCNKHGTPLMQENKWCEECIAEHIHEISGKGKLKKLRKKYKCLYGYEFDIGESWASIMNNLSEQEFERYKARMEEGRKLTVEELKKDSHNLYGVNSGLLFAVSMKSGLAEGMDFFVPFFLSVDSVEIRKKGNGVKKVYPVWLIDGMLPEDIR